ncbi:MAG: hypothetical protein HY204_02485 [Nitrospirae bacterium]|nr:hypothetical protein [Nitrospirota bacterium]
MKLCLAGVNHHDPLGRRDLKQWLRKLNDKNAGPPAFVAVEYDEDRFGRIIAQRERFRGLLQGQWHSLSSAELDILESSLAYEGDTHREIFSDVEILWVDIGPAESRNTIDIDKYAELRLNLYVERSGGQWPGSIDRLSELIRAATKQGIDNLDRSKRFAQQIQNRAAKSGGDWAIVITGSAHTRNTPGSMRSLLEDADFTCEVDILWSA